MGRLDRRTTSSVMPTSDSAVAQHGIAISGCGRLHHRRCLLAGFKTPSTDKAPAAEHTSKRTVQYHGDSPGISVPADRCAWRDN